MHAIPGIGTLLYINKTYSLFQMLPEMNALNRFSEYNTQEDYLIQYKSVA